MSHDLASAMEPTAIALLGKPGKILSGGKEWRYGNNGSLEVRTDKGLFHNHETGAKGGTLALIEEMKGLKGREAFEWMKSIGVEIDDGRRVNGSHPPKTNGHANGAAIHAAPEQRAKPAGKREIVETYPFRDADGVVLYEEVRFQTRLPNGKWETGESGKPTKTIRQRRPDPDNPGEWLWNLDGVAHALYDFPEIREEMLLAPSERRAIFIPEGPRKCEVLKGWGLLATTNGGGAANWRGDHAAHLAGADVVLLLDNDEAGRKRGEKLAASLTEATCRVRVLDWAKWWPECPPKGDVVDWRDKQNGDCVKLYGIIDNLPVWSPAPFISKFGFLPFEKLDEPGPEHSYIVDGILSVGDKSIVGGPSMSGKSFLAIHMAFCIALGRDFFGRKIFTPGLVVVQAGEGARGIKKRLRAYRQHYGVGDAKIVPLVILQSKVDLWRADGDTKALIEELRGISALYRQPIVAVIVDTLATATAGADENSGKDMSSVMANIDDIQRALKTHVSLVHHLNAAGTKLRGHSSILANIDQVLMVNKDEETKIRTAVVGKQKDGEDGATIKFELMQVETGRYRAADDKPETSCVCTEIGVKDEARKQAEKWGAFIQPKEEPIFRAFWATRKAHGFLPDDEAIKKGAPPASLVVTSGQFRDIYRSQRFDGGDSEITNDAIRKVWERNAQGLIKFGILGFSSPYIWWTGKPVRGYPETQDNTRTNVGQSEPATKDDGDLDF